MVDVSCEKPSHHPVWTKPSVSGMFLKSAVIALLNNLYNMQRANACSSMDAVFKESSFVQF